MVLSLSLRRAFTLMLIVAALGGQASIAHAGTLGGIAGFVTDAKTGAPIAGARVEIRSPSQSVTAMTDAKGHYVALSLPPDDYTLTVQKDAYVTQSFSSYSVFADQTQQYDLKLQPGQEPSQENR
ncbi:MAG TPA: carboxypeptidase-like regulatory domain-containing protein [Candidatus Cybelea sp.]|nr:carboxypeptidase-like regulatory domain-containing protein [Candidatus Cybelea sp.]